MDRNASRSSGLPQPLRAVASGLRHVPGAEQVGRVAGGALDAIGAVSPRGRRMAVYTGAGVLGVAGVVEWPVALTGAAVAWLTQPRPGPRPEGAEPSDGGAPAAADGQRGSHVWAGKEREPGPGAEPGSESPAGRGPGDRLAPSHRPHEAEQHVHEQPAKVGDTATASALKQVAEATTHQGGAHGRPHDDRHTG
ncbi:hypothetical protein GCM10019016_134440 [Streptomyces prasinosporus]|uniref:Uncharacterized protein n=1 Tax=Streptomyces prasinosporus TaxID=68256 RepID=A0ABP6UIM4_9ACTN